jgi:hypothetical protein
MSGTLIPQAPPAAPLLLDRLMPSADATATVTITVDAPADVTWAALQRADFAQMPERDPLLRWIIAARALPDRLSRRLRGETAEMPVAATGGRLSEMGEGPDAWIRLGEVPGAEFAFGAIGRFVGAQVNWRRTSAREFTSFAEPGYVRIAAGLSVHPYGDRRCLLTYDCRSTATDAASREAFNRYWKLLSPGIRVVLWRALVAIKQDAEGRAATP